MNLNSRRTFLKNSFLTSVIIITCKGELFGGVTPMRTIALVHKDLFPESGSAPSQDDINSSFYLNSILNHSRVTDTAKGFIRNGVKWLNEVSVSKYKKVYTRLSSSQRQIVLKDIALTEWGKSWIETIMSYLLEAMLGDPIYGGNRAQSGWKWLEHKSGLPRPTKRLT